MKDYPIFTVLIFLILTSLNLGAEALKDTLRSYLRHSALVHQLSGGEKTNDVMTKFYERRAAGILPQPRIGRAPNFAARPDGAVGLVHYPRVGRSGQQASTSPTEQNYLGEIDAESSSSQIHPEDTMDLMDYQDRFDDEPRRRIENNGLWLGVQPKYYTRKEPINRYNRCDSQIDGSWAFLISPSRDLPKIQRQSTFKFIPQFKTSSDSDSVPSRSI